jgi:secondary thiamine-phosphate synthase enzyme
MPAAVSASPALSPPSLAQIRTATYGEAGALVRQVMMAIDTRQPLEFVDVTSALSRVVEEAGLVEGLLSVQTRHTTTGLLINEHEPLLLSDLEAMFERLVPASTSYAHDDFSRRTVNLSTSERRNGHAHCRAALLRTSECVPVTGGRLSLGRWQRIFLVDFDGGQHRELSLTLIGTYRRLAGGNDGGVGNEAAPPLRSPTTHAVSTRLKTASPENSGDSVKFR